MLWHRIGLLVCLIPLRRRDPGPPRVREYTHSWGDVTSCATLGAHLRKHLFAGEPFAPRELGVHCVVPDDEAERRIQPWAHTRRPLCPALAGCRAAISSPR